MARKGNRKKGVSGSEAVLPKVVSEEESSEVLTESVKKNHHDGRSDKKRKHKTRIPFDTDVEEPPPPLLCDTNAAAADYNKSAENELNTEEHVNGATEALEFSSAMILEYLRIIVLSISEASRKSHELVVTLSTKTQDAFKYVRLKIEHAYPIVFRWAMHFGKIMLLLFMVWLDCALRGFESFLRMRTTSFFAVLWCSVLSIIAMIGMFKFLLFLAMAAVIALFIGFTVGFLMIGIFGVVLLWFYGSFWTTTLIVFLGGLGFLCSRERFALFIMTVYSVYCAWTYVGWLGVVLAMNLSFLSSDALIYIVSNHMDQTSGMRGRQPGFFPGEPMPMRADDRHRNSGIPSTSGSDSDEDEVTRLLNSIDHYSALGLSRFENVDVSILKREYKKKAMLVHPDKNMGNEKAVEAFKKLQNAYEVLLDSFKRKAYDDELRREEVLNYIRRFQNPSHQSRRNGGLFSSTFGRTEAYDEEISAESRRIACRKCGDFHIWVYTKKSKSKARWCQECKDYHAAKDGDGWVEQSSQPFFFGIMHKVDAPAAFICAESRIYDATEWYICQGMRCAVNTHKPTFHINTNLTTKQHNNGKGTSPGQRGGGGIPPMPPNMEENMSEEEFFEWFQNAAQSGMFENFPGTSETSPYTQPGNTPKSSSGNASKRKKRGKK